MYDPCSDDRRIEALERVGLGGVGSAADGIPNRRGRTAVSMLERMDPAIRMTGVTKTFGRTTAVAELDLEVPRGGLYGFIGPNGAGKTTSSPP